MSFSIDDVINGKWCPGVNPIAFRRRQTSVTDRQSKRSRVRETEFAPPEPPEEPYSVAQVQRQDGSTKSPSHGDQLLFGDDSSSSEDEQSMVLGPRYSKVFTFL